MTAGTRALLIDMDGALYQGDQVIPGAPQVLIGISIKIEGKWKSLYNLTEDK